MGRSIKVWRDKNGIKSAPGRRHCNCRYELVMSHKMTEQVCDECQHVKHVRKGYEITVGIEKGMQDGQAAVDLKFRIRTAPHELFKREGNDLHTTVTITPVQSLDGFEKTIKHLDDHLVDISSKAIINFGEVRKFKGEGMPIHSSNKKGDLYITFEVKKDSIDNQMAESCLSRIYDAVTKTEVLQTVWFILI